MSNVCLPTEFLHDQRLAVLSSPVFRAAVAIIGDMQNLPKGALNDDRLFMGRRGLGAVGRALLIQTLLEMGEWRYKVMTFGAVTEARLVLAGRLAPHDAEEEDEAAESKPNALRMQINRSVKRAVTEALIDLGLVPGNSARSASEKCTKRPEIVHENEAQDAQNTPNHPLESELTASESAQNGAEPHVYACVSESESESDPILFVSKEKSESDSDSDDTARSLCAEFGMESVFDALRGEHYSADVVLHVIGTSVSHFKDIGETRTPRTILNYCRRGCQNRIKDLAKGIEKDHNTTRRFDGMLQGAVPGGKANQKPAGTAAADTAKRTAPTCTLQKPTTPGVKPNFAIVREIGQIPKTA